LWLNGGKVLVVNLLKEARLEKGISQKELADKTHISVGEISQIENGQRMPGIDIALYLCHALDVDLKKVFYLTEKEKESGKYK
jgi:putative transcriptional regulator